MSLELGIVVGLGGVAFILGYFAMAFRTNVEGIGGEIANKLGLFLFLMSVIFLNLLMYALLLMTQQAGLTYLQGPVMNIGLSIMTYGTIFAVLIFVIYLFILLLVGMAEWFTNMIGRKRG